MSQFVYETYETPHRFPEMIHYLDRHFSKLELWYDWMLFQSVGLYQVQRIRQNQGLTKSRAERIIWNAFAAAFQADQMSPLFSYLHRLIQNLSPSEKPLFIAHTMIAVQIHRGQSVDEARDGFLIWLQEDPSHAIFGDFRLTPHLTTEALGRSSGDDRTQ